MRAVSIAPGVEDNGSTNCFSGEVSYFFGGNTMEHMEQLLAEIAACIERGKMNAASPHPPDMRGMDGADECTRRALSEGIPAQRVLDEALMPGMRRIGERFRDKLIFVPDVLLAARAMSAAMKHLQPYFQSSEATHRGTFVIGTVRGDLHDIGKKLVSMIVEGAGWAVVDLGTDVSPERFAEAARTHPGCAVGLSALLTTTMAQMEAAVRAIRDAAPEAGIIVGGAPVTRAFAESIGADAYAPDPQGAVDFLQRRLREAP
jgi:methanogenic corrinoid protein MtbC1